MAPTASLAVERRLAELHRVHHLELVQLAAVFVDDMALCEEVVQNSFVGLDVDAVHDADSMTLRHQLCRRVIDGAHAVARTSVASTPLMARLRTMPREQADVLVLSQYMGIEVDDVAALTGRRPRATKRLLRDAKRLLAAQESGAAV